MNKNSGSVEKWEFMRSLILLVIFLIAECVNDNETLYA